MWLTRVHLPVLLMGVAVTIMGKPVEDLVFVHVLAGETLIQHCSSDMSDKHSGHMTVEWFRTLNGMEVVVMAVRKGVELEMEKDPKYINRSSPLEDGTLKLIGVTPKDTGRYRCVRRSKSALKELSFQVTVCQSSTVDMGVLRSAENDLFVTCESTGWIGGTQILLVDFQGGVLTNEMEEGIGPDGCTSVSVSLNITSHESFRNGTIVCTVKSPGSTLVKSNKMAVTDELKLDELHIASLNMNNLVWAIAILFVVLVVVLVQMWGPFDIKQSFSALVTKIGLEDAADEQHERLLPDVEEVFEDITDITTTGASLVTAKLKGLLQEHPRSGVAVSEKLARLDLQAMSKYQEDIMHIGRDLKLAPCLIAGIISRQSNAGTQLRPNGFGLHDENCYGLMQFNRYYQSVTSGPCSQDHIRQGVAFLIQLLKTMWRERPKWNREQLLKGALASYIIGEDKVLSLKPSENVDRFTPQEDFANDVIARAHFYAINGFPNIRQYPV